MSVYAGKFLRLDLSAGTRFEESIEAGEVRRWLLGSGMAAKLYHQEMDPELDPLDPKSPLLIFNGVLAGTCQCSPEIGPAMFG
jgi:aldehyde:ferredoxin oxidoreductase